MADSVEGMATVAALACSLALSSAVEVRFTTLHLIRYENLDVHKMCSGDAIPDKKSISSHCLYALL